MSQPSNLSRTFCIIVHFIIIAEESVTPFEEERSDPEGEAMSIEGEPDDDTEDLSAYQIKIKL